ncbi:hypothetical protein [Nocardia arthritidis]|uniref:DUF2637 domain-containing protein n=1 Tax=Nocardia arthritidis TaxID=228602 RepID=A0A6G9Y6R6_9NOCA|nr:hypothetical protein [Nocardia arthritidis]QIS08901.1 hypothetical protein F5544_04945 [Nocardia arthritidis]
MVDRQSQENSDEIAALAQRVAVARGKLPLQHDTALFEVLSEAEIDAERELAEWVRAKRRGQRRRAVADELAAEKRDRRTARGIERAADEDARWHRRALAARRRAASQDARLAQLYRRAEWSARALIGVVVLGMVWAGVNVQHNLVPSGDMTDPLYWLSYGIEAMISIPIITIMVVATTAARWGRELDRGKVVFFETALLGTTIALNAGPHLAAGEWGRAAEYAIAPIMVGVVIWLHAWVSARYAMLIDGVPMASDDEAPAPRRRITTERGAPVTATRQGIPADIRELAAVENREPTPQITARFSDFDAQQVTEAGMRNLTNAWTPTRVDHTETLLYHAQSTTHPADRATRPIDAYHCDHESSLRATYPNASITTRPATPTTDRTGHLPCRTPSEGTPKPAQPNPAQSADSPDPAPSRAHPTAETDHTDAISHQQSALGHNGSEVYADPARTTRPQHTAAPQSADFDHGTTHSDASTDHLMGMVNQQTSRQNGFEIGASPAGTTRPRSVRTAQWADSPDSGSGPAYSAAGAVQHRTESEQRPRNSAEPADRTPPLDDSAHPVSTPFTVVTSSGTPTHSNPAARPGAANGSAIHAEAADEDDRPTAAVNMGPAARGDIANGSPIHTEVSRRVATTNRTESGFRVTGADEAIVKASAASGPAPKAPADTVTASEPASPTSATVRSARRTATASGRAADDSEGALESQTGSEQLALNVDTDPVERAGTRSEPVGERPGSKRDSEPNAARPVAVDRGKSTGTRNASEVIREAAEAISAEELVADEQLIEPENDDAGIWAVARAIVGRGLSQMPVEQLAEILTLADQSWTPTSIGAEVGLSRTAIAQVLECARKVRRPYAISG